jgi:hypothetical protein
MRKYFVTLLVVDQRPSGIDNEVMSQIGTRITALLNDEKDIDAIFTGVSGAQSLRSVLAKLDSKQQALILGHATPMPVVVKTRAYDEQFYAEVGEPAWEELPDAIVFKAAEAAKPKRWSVTNEDLYTSLGGRLDSQRCCGCNGYVYRSRCNTADRRPHLTDASGRRR